MVCRVLGASACLFRAGRFFLANIFDMTKKTKPKGRPATKRGAYNPNPARQLGRVPDAEWEILKAAAGKAGLSFTQWAVDILLRAAIVTGTDEPLDDNKAHAIGRMFRDAKSK